MQIKCLDCEFRHSFYTSPQIHSAKDNCSRGMKTMEINVRAVYGFRSIRVIHIPLTLESPITGEGGRGGGGGAWKGLKNSVGGFLVLIC